MPLRVSLGLYMGYAVVLLLGGDSRGDEGRGAAHGGVDDEGCGDRVRG